MSFATFGDPKDGGWGTPFDGGPEFTSSDEDADMVAVFDKIPKDIKTRMLFSGKVEGAAVWSAVLQQMLESRLSPWQYAIISGDLSSAMVQKRDDAEEVAAAATLTCSYAAFLLPLIDRETAEGSTLVALIIVRKDLMKDGVALHRYMTSRGKAETTMQVTQAFDEIAKVKLSFGGTNLEH